MKMKQGIKRKMALLLSSVLLMQSVFTGAVGATGGTGRAESEPTAGTVFDILGTPQDAFDKLSVKIGNQVTADNELWFRVDGRLNDEFLMDEYEKFLHGGGLTVDEFPTAEYATYDAYLNAQSALPEMKFSISLKLLNSVALDIGKLLPGTIEVEMENEDGDKVTVEIGKYTLSTSSGGTSPRLEVNINKAMYRYTGVTFGKSIFATLKDLCEPDSEVIIKPGSGSNDFIIDIPTYGEAGLENSGYKITKKAKANEEDLSIEYTILAQIDGTRLRASNGELVKASSAEPGEKYKSSRKKVATSEELDEDKTLDPDDDEDWISDGDDTFKGPGLTDLIDFLVPQKPSSQLIASGGERGLDDTLAGKVITDRIPDGLTLISVEERLNNGSYEAAVYECVDGALRYQIPSPSDGEKIESAELKIVTRLSDEEYNKYLISGAKTTTYNFINKAFLKGEGETNLAVSETVKTPFALEAPLVKDGKPLSGTSNRKFEWVLEVNSNFSNSSRVTLFVVDYIANIKNTHNYISEDPDPDSDLDMVTIGADKQAVIKIQGLQDKDTYAYDKIEKVSVIEGLLERYNISKDTTSPIVYEYLSHDDQDDAKDIYDAVMLIPLQNYINEAVDIKYNSEITVPLEELYTGEKPVEVKNLAKILWRWDEGGPGPGTEFGGARVEKKPIYHYSLVNKTTGGYEESTNTIDWKFEVNQLGIEAGSIKIEDIFDNAKQQLHVPQAGSNGQYPALPIATVSGSGSRTYIPWVETEPTDPVTPESYYMVDTTSEPGKTKLTVVFRNVTAEEHYSFNIETLVTDLSLGTTGTQTEVENNAKVTVSQNGVPTEFEINAKCPVFNTLIRKSAVSFDGEENAAAQWYNYEDNTVKWRVVINPRKWPISSPVITDVLPEGTHFADLTYAAYIGADGTEQALSFNHDGSDKWSPNSPSTTPWIVTNTNAGSGSIEVLQEASPGNLKFDFKPKDSQTQAWIEESYVFEFTSHVTDAKRRKFKSGGASKPELVNEATLDGFWGTDNSQTNPIKATDKATNIYLPAPMIKNGKYFEAKDITIEGQSDKAYGVEWKLLVNRTGADMGGAVITDEIAPCMELLLDTMKVSVVTLNEAGNVVGEGTPIDPTVLKQAFSPLQFDEFKFTIPTENKTDTLQFEFTTVMVDDANSKDIKNQVSIQGTGLVDSTDDVIADNSKDFRLEDYATAALLSFLKLYKTSDNEKNPYPLEGAEFKITELSPPALVTDRGNAASWSAVNPAKVKVRTTNASGAINFMFLKPDTLYLLEETEPPLGYEASKIKWYIVPKLKTDAVYPNSETGKHEVMINKTAKNYLSQTVKNIPVGGGTGGNGSISFVKKGQADQLLEGVKFTLTHPIFTRQVAYSDENGVVKFDKVDASTEPYTIEEMTPNGYKTGLVLKVKVTLSVDGKSTIAEFVDSPNEFTPATGNAPNILTNTPITADGSFTKADQNGNPLLQSGITFEVKRKGDAGRHLQTSGGGICIDVLNDPKVPASDKETYFAYDPQIYLTSDANGVVSFTDFYYGDYELTEESGPSNPLPGATPEKLYLRIDKNGKATIKSASETKWSEALSDKYSFKNKIEYGVLQVKKAVGEKSDGSNDLTAAGEPGSPILIDGIKFKVYRDLNQNSTLDAAADPLLMEIATKNGTFQVSEDGWYTTTTANVKKQLPVGHYILEEQNSPDYIRPLTYQFPFIIGSWPSNSDANYKPSPIYMDEKGQSDTSATLFLNEPKRAAVELTKKDSVEYNQNALLSGAEFSVFAKNKSGQDVYVANLAESSTPGKYVLAEPTVDAAQKPVCDDKGRAYLKKVSDNPLSYELLYGTYTVKETKAPADYKLSTETISVVIADNKVSNGVVNAEFKNTIITKDIKIRKLIENRIQNQGSFETKFLNYSDAGTGFKFTLYGKNESGAAHPGPENLPTGGTYEKSCTTNTVGIAELKDVPVGTYLLTETSVPEKYGKISDPFVESELFIKRMPPITVKVEESKVTYTFVNAPEGFSDTTISTVSGNGPEGSFATIGETTGELRVYNNLKLGSAEGTKVGIADATMDSSQGQPLSGVAFTLKNEAGLEMQLTSAQDGKISVTKLPFGKYTLTENTPPAGYAIPSGKVEFTISDTSTPVKITSDGAAAGYIENILLKKSLKFAKIDQNGVPLGSGRTSKVEFDVTRKSGSIPATVPGYTDQAGIKPDEQGFVTLTDLPYGIYTVTEKKVTGDPVLPDNANVFFEVKIEADGADKTKLTIIPPVGNPISLTQVNSADMFDLTASFKLVNSLKHGDIRILKKLGEFDNAGYIKDLDDGLSGIKFEIYQKTGSQTKPAEGASPYITLTTDNNGRFKSSNGWYGDDTANRKQLLAGKYFLKEIVPAGHRPLSGAAEYIEFEVYDSSSGYVTEFTHDGNGTPVVSKVQAAAQPGSFYNIKESGNIEGMKYANDKGTKIPLGGAKFKLTSRTDPTYPVKYIISNSSGKISYKELPLGEYTLAEVEAPEGYAKSNTERIIKLEQNKVTVSLDTSGEPVEFINEAAGTILIEKRAQIIANGDITGVMRPGAGFLFKITGQSLMDNKKLEEFIGQDDVTGADGIEIKSAGAADDGLYITTGSAGKVTIKNLPVGNYKIQEQINEKNDTAGSYRPDTTTYTADITINHTTGKVSAPEVKVDNLLKRGKLQGIKTTSDKTTPLAGAVIGLFPAGTTSFTEENLWCGMKVTTGADGLFLFENLPYGSYLIKELAAPSGYKLNTTTVYEAVVSDEATTKTTGLLIEGESPKAEQETPILIANTKKPSGGGGGGGGGDKPPTPTGPGPGTPTTSPNETSPVNPGETTPLNPLPTLPVESAPGGGTDIIIPPDTPPGSGLEIKDPDGNTIFKGTVGDNGRLNVDLPPGTYTLVTFDENQVPLGSMTFTIEDPYTPLGVLAAPDAGDHSVPFVVLAVLMMASLSGIILIIRKKAEEKRK